MKFSVTTEDIANSFRKGFVPPDEQGHHERVKAKGHPSGCPVAAAIVRLVGPTVLVAVGEAWITVGRKAYPTPLKVRQFVQRYDSHKSVGPIEFELPDPK